MSDDRADGLLSLADVTSDAPVGDPEEEGLAELRDLGRDLTNGLFQTLRILAIHSADNAAVDEPLRRLERALVALFNHTQTVHFITVEGQVYLNDLRVKMEASSYGNVTYLLGQLGRHGIGGITFLKPPGLPDLKRLMQMVLHTKPPTQEGEDPLDHIRAMLDQADIPDIEFDRPYYFKQGDDAPAGSSGAEEEEDGAQEQAALSYVKGVLAVKDYLRAVEAAESANPLRIRKIVHDLVDVAEDDPEDFLKLHVIRGVEDPYYNHCINVATLSVSIGRVLGLTRVELADLGSAAMFHDLGYAAIERQEVEEQRQFSDRDRMRLHPVAGFRALLRQGEYGPGLLRRLLVTLEHHMHFERPGGYPKLGRKSLSVFTRVVAVADHYDALVAPTGEVAGILPVKALERIVAAAGTHFDPTIVKALVQVVGRYPYGSLVRFNTGELGVVNSGGRDEERFMKPLVMVVRSGDGTEVPPHVVDLGVLDVLRRRIVDVIDPFEANVTPHAVLFDRLDSGGAGTAAAEAEVGAGVDAWNAAVWDGEDAVTAVIGVLNEEFVAPGPSEEELQEEELAQRVPNLSRFAPRSDLGGERAALSAFFPAFDDEGFEPGEERSLTADAASSLIPTLDSDELSPEEAEDLRQAAPPAHRPGGHDDVLAWLDAELSRAAAGSKPGSPVAPQSSPSEAVDVGGETVVVTPLLGGPELRIAPLWDIDDDDDEDDGGIDDLPPLLDDDFPEDTGAHRVLDFHEEPAFGAGFDEEDVRRISDDDAAWLAGMGGAAESPLPAAPAPPPASAVAPRPPPVSPATAAQKLEPKELNRQIQQAFHQGGEDAVQRLMERLRHEGKC